MWPVWTVGIIVAVNDNLVEVTSIDGPSMSPTLSAQYHETGKADYVVWRKWDPARNLRRGDLVSFLAPHKPDKLVAKRVVGLEGDTVLLDERRKPEGEGLVGEKLSRDWDIMGHWDWQSAARMKEKGETGSAPAVHVPWRHVWVEGDNWRRSEDSNTYGPISKSLIIGKGVCVFSPFRKFGTKPWEGVQGDTVVKHGRASVPEEWRD